MSRLFKLIHRLGEGIRDPQAELTRLQATVRYAYLLGRHGGRQLLRHRAPLLAGALAFRTIFSLIPVLALVLVTLRLAFGEDGIRSGLTTLMTYTGLNEIALEMDVAPPDAPAQAVEAAPEAAAPEGAFFGPVAEPSMLMPPNMVELPAVEEAGSLTAWIETFVANATAQVTDLNITGITLISLVVFIYAAMSLLIQVESAFNVVLGARRGRRCAQRVLIYWALLTLGSLLIAFGIFTGQLYQQGLADLPGWLAWSIGPARFIGAVVMSWLVLVLAYRWHPAVCVGLRATAIGALVAAVGFEGAKELLAGLIRSVAEGQVVVYGSLALIPLTMLWVYVVWLIVLFGLELANAISTLSQAELRGEFRRGPDEASLPSGSLAAGLATVVARSFDAGEPIVLGEASRLLAAPSAHVAAVADVLVEDGVLRWVEDEEDEARTHQALTLGRPASKIMLAELFRAQRRVTHDIGDPRIARVCLEMQRTQEAALEERSLGELLSELLQREKRHG